MFKVLRKIQQRFGNGETNAVRDCETFAGHRDQAFGHITYAQHGEDLIVCNIFAILGVTRPTFLDLGAHHPFHSSNTALLYARGSNGFNIEANPDLIPAFVEARPRDVTINIGVGRAAGLLPFYRIDKFSGRNSFDLKTVEDFVALHPEFSITDALHIQVLTINEIVERYCGGRFPNFLTMDVEGLDQDILEGADFSTSRPDVICVEIDKCSSRFISNAMLSNDFVPYCRTWGNLLFVTNETYRVLTRDMANE